MRKLGITLVKMTTETRAVALAAAKEAFPEVEVREVDSFDAIAPGEAPQRLELVVLAEPDAALAAGAVQALSPAGRPRWAVVILGHGSSDVAEIVPPEEWNARALARIFRAVLLQHELLCENLQLRGDLRTVARRVSHDLRTPVGCIHTSSDVLNELPPDDPSIVAGITAIFKQSSAEISAIIDRVSFLIKASLEPLPPARVEMEDVVANTLRQLEPEIKRSGASLALPSGWPAVSGVAPWLQVIWSSLVENALAHGRGARVELGWEPDGDSYRFFVSDRGPGVPAGQQAALFTPFDQLHAGHAKGLGLPVVQRLLALQGGTCGYTAQPGGGARFHFTLPGYPRVAA